MILFLILEKMFFYITCQMLQLFTYHVLRKWLIYGDEKLSTVLIRFFVLVSFIILLYFCQLSCFSFCGFHNTSFEIKNPLFNSN